MIRLMVAAVLLTCNAGCTCMSRSECGWTVKLGGVVELFMPAVLSVEACINNECGAASVSVSPNDGVGSVTAPIEGAVSGELHFVNPNSSFGAIFGFGRADDAVDGDVISFLMLHEGVAIVDFQQPVSYEIDPADDFNCTRDCPRTCVVAPNCMHPDCANVCK